MRLPVTESPCAAQPSYIACVELDGEYHLFDGPAELSAVEIVLALLAGLRDSSAGHVKIEVAVK